MEVWDQIEIYENVNAKLLDDDDEHFKIMVISKLLVVREFVFFSKSCHIKSHRVTLSVSFH
jgi:hypothetical protein